MAWVTGLSRDRGMQPGAEVILIVDDSEPCSATLEMALVGLEAMETCSARTADEALAIFTSDRCRVRAIVTDLNLPAMDGFELIERIRRKSPQAAVPILVTSGDSDPGNSARLRSLGVDAYFVKPYSPAAVRRTLERLLHAAKNDAA